jgi:hypothetical protein
MRHAGVSTARERSRRARAWIDFGVDESWERAAPRRGDRDLAAAEHREREARAVSVVQAPGPRVNLSDTAGEWSHASAVSTPAPRPSAGGPADGRDTAREGTELWSPSVPPGRRTVVIRGRGAERDLAFGAQRPARRASSRPHERPGFKPDRAAMWAILLGIFLVLVAATSSHAATLRIAARGHRAALAAPAAHVVRVPARVAR